MTNMELQAIKEDNYYFLNLPSISICLNVGNIQSRVINLAVNSINQKTSGSSIHCIL